MKIVAAQDRSRCRHWNDVSSRSPPTQNTSRSEEQQSPGQFRLDGPGLGFWIASCCTERRNKSTVSFAAGTRRREVDSVETITVHYCSSW